MDLSEYKTMSIPHLIADGVVTTLFVGTGMAVVLITIGVVITKITNPNNYTTDQIVIASWLLSVTLAAVIVFFDIARERGWITFY